MDYISIRNFKDFLQVYNTMSETCFLRCAQTFNSRDLTADEVHCVNLCAQKHINVNHKVMQIYMEVQPQMVNSRIEEMNKKQANIEADTEPSMQLDLHK